MKVKELIAKLNKLNQEDEIYIDLEQVEHEWYIFDVCDVSLCEVNTYPTQKNKVYLEG